MAFEASTRNRLSKFVGDCRTLLTLEFTRQLTRDYGLNPENGTVADVDGLQLDDAGRETAQILRDTMQHYLAVSAAKPKDVVKEVLQRIVREQAFTVLNRLCALRMAESRDLFIESVRRGIQSDGFQLYSRLAGTALGDTGEMYRSFLFGVFDELAIDLPVLFDRFSENGRLFPSDPVLLKVLEEINDHDLEHLWAEDETIGWIYQYFNTAEDRRLARYTADGKPKPPQNSRELAVRNQFFTPRYVVEFLTDNTLGRIWYEMRKGETTFREECQYLVRRPNEIFLAEGEEAQETNDAEQNKDLTQEELLNQPIRIPHRPLKDPREIRMLDPACGSMHFGLYAFDLYLKIYEEYWDLVTSDPSVTIEPIDLPKMTEVYQSRDSFLRDIPRLIIEHNIHGIDIDPRAVQIAGLSLWLRAQRAWSMQGLASADRPQVTRSNVVCAEPMPGDQKQLESFCKELHPAVSQMVTAIFEAMKLAGEAGSLLKIEEEISSLVAKAKKQFKDNPPNKKTQSHLFDGVNLVKQQLVFDLSGITDEQFFEKVEEDIYGALRKYVNESSEGGFRRKLFIDDAEKVFEFIDLCRKRYDAVLMNPPFGTATEGIGKLLKVKFDTCKHDLALACVDAGIDICTQKGRLGAIITRTPFFLPTSGEWRSSALLGTKAIADCLADFGVGVLDATVESAAFTTERDRLTCDSLICSRQVESKDKGSSLKEACQKVFQSQIYDGVFVVPHDEFECIPFSPISYWAPKSIRQIFVREDSFKSENRDAKCGLGTLDDFRFIRLFWEVPEDNRWVPYADGGTFIPFFESSSSVTNWGVDGREVKAFVEKKVGSASRKVQGASFYFQPGLTFPRRTKRFCPRPLPSGTIFSTAGQGVFFESVESAKVGLGILSTDICKYLISLSLGTNSQDQGGTNPQFEVGLVKRLPWPNLQSEIIRDLAVDAAKSIRRVESRNENSRFYVGMTSGITNAKTPADVETIIKNEILSSETKIANTIDSLNNEVAKAYGITNDELMQIKDELGSCDDHKLEKKTRKNVFESIFSWLFGISVGHWKCDTSPSSELERDPFNELPTNQPSRSKMLGECIFTNASLLERIRLNTKVAFPRSDNEFEVQLCVGLGSSTLEKYLDDLGGFFSNHLGTYTENRRSAPIYWPISTESGAYTLWFYYHRLTDQMLYKAVNDFVDPKLKDEIRPVLNDLRATKERSSAQERELAQLTQLESELEQFKADLLEIAAFWKPNLNDGVQITAAPLWKYFRLTKWRNKLKKTWEELQEGKYDWAHLALCIWPDRVVREKCINDRSIAIAHDLEEQLWHEVEVIKTGRGGRETKKLEWHPRDLTDAELDALVEEVKSR